MCASMIPLRILLRAVKRQTQERIVNSNAVKRGKLAGSRDRKVYRAGTVGACCAPRQRRAFASCTRRARSLPDRVLELSRHARGTSCPIRPMAPFLQRGVVVGDEGAASEVSRLHKIEHRSPLWRTQEPPPSRERTMHKITLGRWVGSEGEAPDSCSCGSPCYPTRRPRSRDTSSEGRWRRALVAPPAFRVVRFVSGLGFRVSGFGFRIPWGSLRPTDMKHFLHSSSWEGRDGCTHSPSACGVRRIST